MVYSIKEEGLIKDKKVVMNGLNVISLTEGILVDGITIFKADFRENERNGKKEAKVHFVSFQDEHIHNGSSILLEVFVSHLEIQRKRLKGENIIVVIKNKVKDIVSVILISQVDDNIHD